MSRQLLLLNETLRLQDNPLLNVPKTTDSAYAVILLNQHQFEQSSPKRQALQAALIADFAKQLAARGIQLHCYIAEPWQQLQKLIKAWQIELVVAATPCAIDEVRLFDKVSSLCKVQLLDCNSLLDGQLAPDYQRFPKSCSQFRSQREPELLVSAPIADRCCPSAFIGNGCSPFTSQTETNEQFAAEYSSEGASKRWQNYLQSPAFSAYLQTRNQLYGADYASFLSVALAFGTLSVRQCWQDLQQGPQHPSAVWLKQELFWREYFRHYFRVHGAACFAEAGLARRAPLPKFPKGSSAARENFRRWQQGETGVPFIDANMRLLTNTGLMSNRGRQNVASYLVFELGIDWRLGATFFEQQLLDFDVASNWGNWAYIAGAGEGPARHFNVMKQALQYDKDAEFVSLLLPDINSTLTGPAKHRPYPIHGSTPWQESWAPYLP